VNEEAGVNASAFSLQSSLGVGASRYQNFYKCFLDPLLMSFRGLERTFRCFDSVVSQPGHTSVIDSNLLSYMGFNGQA
jgi:hypothetical protein